MGRPSPQIFPYISGDGKPPIYEVKIRASVRKIKSDTHFLKNLIPDH